MSDKSVEAAIGKPKASKRRFGCWSILLIVVVLVVGGSIAASMLYEPPPTPWKTAEIERGDLQVTVTATGNLEPTNQVQVGAETSGTIEAVFVDFNDPVTVGQVLAKLDTEQQEAQVLQAEASLEQAQARVAQAEATATERRARQQRVAQLRRTRNASQQDLDIANAELKRAEADIRSAKAQVRVAEALLKLERSRLSKSEIKSPIDGIVLERLVETGQTVAASFQTPHLFTLAETLTQMDLVVDVDEADIGTVTTGLPAVFRVDAYPERQFEAEITQVRNAPKLEQGVVSYEALLSVQNPELLLKPGMTASAVITVDEVEDVLIVPSSALRFTPPRARSPGVRVEDGKRFGYVWRLGSDGKPLSVEVQLGRTDGRKTEIITDRLSAGDTLLVGIFTQAELRQQREAEARQSGDTDESAGGDTGDQSGG